MATISEDQKLAQSMSRGSSISSGMESSCLASPTHVKFSCGCGKCSIVGYLTTDKDCPSGTLPAITLSTQDPPFPDDMITDTEMSYARFKQCLKDETGNIYAHFCAFLFDTFQELSSVNFNQLKEYIFHLLAIDCIEETIN